MSLQIPDRAAFFLARPLIVFAVITRPMILLMNGLANFILKRLGFQRVTGEEMVHSVEELMLLIEDTEEAGILDEDQAEFVQNVFRLSDKHVGACMVPRDKMAALEVHTPPEKVLEAVRNGAHTRMPVYDTDPNEIVGIVNTKDLFYLFSLQGVVILQDALYPALFLKPEENLDNALRLFRKAKRPMALVAQRGGCDPRPHHAGRCAGRDHRRHRGRTRPAEAHHAQGKTAINDGGHPSDPTQRGNEGKAVVAPGRENANQTVGNPPAPPTAV